MAEFLNALKSFAERITNPFLFSFIAAFLIQNWEVTIALIWYDTEQITKAGHASIYELIETQLNKPFTLCIPLLAAAGFTIFNPLVKMLISAFLTQTREWSESWNFQIQQKAEKKRLAFNDMSFLEGRWTMYTMDGSQPSKEESLLIRSGQWIVTETGETPKTWTYSINSFAYFKSKDEYLIYASIMHSGSTSPLAIKLTIVSHDLLQGSILSKQPNQQNIRLKRNPAVYFPYD